MAFYTRCRAQKFINGIYDVATKGVRHGSNSGNDRKSRRISRQYGRKLDRFPHERDPRSGLHAQMEGNHKYDSQWFSRTVSQQLACPKNRDKKCSAKGYHDQSVLSQGQSFLNYRSFPMTITTIEFREINN